MAKILEKSKRTFFVDGAGYMKKMHLVKQDYVYLPLKERGLGLDNIVERHWSLLAKIWWSFGEEMDAHGGGIN